MPKFAPDGTTWIPWTIDADQVGGVDVDVSPDNTTTYLRADGTWATPPGSGGTVTSVGATAPITSTGGATPTIAISAATTLAAGSMSAADKTKLDGITAGAAVASVGGTAPITSSGGTTPTLSLDANGVTDAKLRQGGALTVIGRSANSTGNVADIAAVAASDAVLRESGSVLGFGTIATGGIANNAVTLAKLATQANSTVLGNVSGGVAVPSALSTTQLTTLVNVFTSILSGAVPASGGGTTNYLRADGTWSSPAAGSFAATTAEVNFTVAQRFQYFDVADASAATTHKVVATVSATMPTGVDSDELEMDPLTVFGTVPVNGTVRFYVACADYSGAIFGKRNINYALG